ncbi:hypothetical protein [Aquibacillus kalidii]|uniref:hypothetical protein n=1 Tax=Aquibacillus kalidii TaxID=2762597 RepID=UPI001C996531|nr:hypothetical protein [Aquibacillus kalidii]
MKTPLDAPVSTSNASQHASSVQGRKEANSSSSLAEALPTESNCPERKSTSPLTGDFIHFT